MWPFKKKKKDNTVTEAPVQSATPVDQPARNTIPAEQIDEDQKVWASPYYVERIYKKYYSRYPEKPFISKDREKNTNWEEMVSMFPDKILKKEMMVRYKDGLLPGHVYMLYWIYRIHKRRIPAYFEYEFGINYDEEREFLIKRGDLSSNGDVTSKGLDDIKAHYQIVLNKSPAADLSFLGIESDIPDSYGEIIVPTLSTRRTISEKEGIVNIPKADMELIKAEIDYLNKHIDNGLRLSKTNSQLSIDFKKLRFGHDYTYYHYQPHTTSGKASKYPLTLHFAYKEHLDPTPQNDCFGTIEYLRDGSIGKARIIFWEGHDGTMFDLAIINGALNVSKVQKTNGNDWNLKFKYQK